MKSKITTSVAAGSYHASKKTVFTVLLALLFCTQAHAQVEDSTLVVLYQSEPGVQPFWLDSFSSFFTDFDNRFDANGDGTSDLILRREDSDGNLQAIRVIDVQTQVVFWEVEDVQETLVDWLLEQKSEIKLYGFVDPDGNGVRDALFAGDQDVVLINPTDNSLEWSCSSTLIQMGADPNCVLVGVTDMTGDGFEEIITFQPDTQIVTVTGSKAASKAASRR